MLYMVAPFESENICKDISSRNIEIMKKYDGESIMVMSDFDHRYKLRHKKTDIKSRLDSWKVNCHIFSGIKYNKNISLKRMLSNFIFAFNCFIYLLKNVKDNDKVYINSIPPEVLFFISLLKKIKKIEVIVDVRDIWPDALVNSSSGLTVSIFKLYCNIIYKLSIGCVDKCVYVAPSFLNWISSKRVNISPQFLPLGFDEARWSMKKLQYRGDDDVIKLDSNIINVVYVGYLSQQFDLSPVIEAFNKLDDNFCLHVIGGGANLDYYKSLSNKNTIFYGMKSPQFVSSNLYKFDIGVLPLREGAASLLPNKFFDYVAAKLPIVSFGSPDVASILSEENIGYSVPGNPSDLYSFFNNIDMEDVDFKKKNINNSRKKYSMQEVYKNLAAYIN